MMGILIIITIYKKKKKTTCTVGYEPSHVTMQLKLEDRTLWV